MLLPIYPAARMGDKIGRRPVLLAAIVAMLVVVYPCFHMMQAGGFFNVLIPTCVMSIILGWYLAPIPALLVEVFPTSIRNTGMSLSYNICAILGGFAPSFSEFLISGTGKDNGLVRFFTAQQWDGFANFTANGTGDITSIQWIIVGSGLLTFISLLFYKDRWREPLPM